MASPSSASSPSQAASGAPGLAASLASVAGLNTTAAVGLWPALAETLGRLFWMPFFFLLSLVLFMSSFGKSLGIRRCYVKSLLKVFEVSRASFAALAVKTNNSTVAGRQINT